MIDLTPLDVRKKRGDFTRVLRGYESASVDQFLELVAERMEELVHENAALRNQVGQLKESVEQFRERERAMNDALVSAQQLREDIRTQAGREAELTLREARARGERIVLAAQRHVDELSTSLRRMQEARAQFLRGFRALIEQQLSVLELEEERDLPTGTEPRTSPATDAGATPPTGRGA